MLHWLKALHQRCKPSRVVTLRLLRSCRTKFEFVQALRDIAKKHLGDDATLYTTDPPGFMMWGGLQGTYHAVDFGPSKPTFLSFVSQKLANANSKEAASFNSEFYTGWLTRWGDKMANTWEPACFVLFTTTCD